MDSENFRMILDSSFLQSLGISEEDYIKNLNFYLYTKEVPANKYIDLRFLKKQIKKYELPQLTWLEAISNEAILNMGINPHPCIDLKYYSVKKKIDDSSMFSIFIDFYKIGRFDGVFVNPLFEPEIYLSNCADIEGPIFDHFVFRWLEKKCQFSRYFDINFYQIMSNKLKFYGNNPLADYFYTDVDCRLDVHPLFDSKTYLQINEDIRQHGMDPLLHYLYYGLAEGRQQNKFLEEEFKNYILTNMEG